MLPPTSSAESRRSEDLSNAHEPIRQGKAVSARRASILPLSPARNFSGPSDLTARYAEKLIQRAQRNGDCRGAGASGIGQCDVHSNLGSCSVNASHERSSGLLHLAHRHAAAGDHALACEALEGAYLASGDPSILIELAIANACVGRRTIAEELFRRLMRDPRIFHPDELVCIQVRATG